MAAIHVRAISLPSSAHPLYESIKEQLNELKAAQAKSPCYKLAGLKNLYECVDDFLQLPLKQQSLSNEFQRECVEDILNGSVRLLDVCSTTTDVLSKTQECIKELEFSLRRRRGRETGLRAEVEAYMASRKNLSNVVRKCLRNWKRKERNFPATSLEDASNLVDVLKDVEEISLQVFESILSSISQLKTKTKPSGWSVVSKLLQSKRVLMQSELDFNELEKIHAELLVLKSSKDISSGQVQNVLKGFEAFESSTKGLEDELECVYRRLVKTRVSLLKVLNH